VEHQGFIFWQFVVKLHQKFWPSPKPIEKNGTLRAENHQKTLNKQKILDEIAR